MEFLRLWFPEKMADALKVKCAGIVNSEVDHEFNGRDYSSK